MKFIAAAIFLAAFAFAALQPQPRCAADEVVLHAMWSTAVCVKGHR